MIKILLIAGLSGIIPVSIVATPAQAQSKEVTTESISMTPRKLISLARQGRFSDQGVPGYSRLGSAIRSGQVNGEKLVTSAIAQNRLPESALEDRDFINAVNHHLGAGGCGSN